MTIGKAAVEEHLYLVNTREMNIPYLGAFRIFGRDLCGGSGGGRDDFSMTAVHLMDYS